MSSEADNTRRWAPTAVGVYEVWYTTWNHPKTGQGYWLRFITEAPHAGSGGQPPYGEAPRGELWFARCDPEDPSKTFGIHKRFRSELVSSTERPFAMTIAGCELGHDHSFGELSGGGHDVRWDLKWEPAARTLRLFPDVLYAQEHRTETTALSPNPGVHLSGTLLVDGEELVFDRARAEQSHVWGKKHAFRWAWAHCVDFVDADAVFLLIAARLRRGTVTLPPAVAMSLLVDGERYHFNQLRHLLTNRCSWGIGRVVVSAWSPTVRLEGELTCTPEQMVNAPYYDPDGTELYCANTTIGDARFTLSKRSGLGWKVHRRLEAPGRAHFEIGGRTRDASVVRPHALVT